ncbi:hypothetical protein H257_15954 [Aphanomyces astaci]|uniref:Uncharacterized protein n=1 Tax=Aphanomyces astaci TaxID=112090 RepID=W4FKI4_APHAT|nr:hypothetical protein H257_15954 [Aphanomyces astaci]ETV67990.1 hypothetical protein H257_15954 [Aphanomyces astaci]|eukprot:XP_009842553.1 hypothetical protein H257_15954 [Aphanomyces astaci]
MAKEGVRIVSTGAIWGYVIVSLSAIFFITFMYLIVVAKVLPPPTPGRSFPMMDAIRGDQHYCYLVPLTIPVAFIAMYVSWVSLKYFRQN